MTEPLVALSINDVRSFAWLARRCVESLRSSGSDLKVVVFLSRGAALDLTHLPNVHLRTVDTDRHTNPFFERWYRISSLEAERVIYLDADTICLQPLELLFEKYAVADMYARREAGTEGRDEAKDGRFPVQVDWEAFQLQQHFYRSIVPVVNAGVMVFNHGACRRMTNLVGTMREIYEGWAEHQVPYPCTNQRIMDELALAAALSRPSTPKLGLITPEDAPFYAELATEEPAHGVVLHVWSGLYRAYLQDFASPKVVSEYDYERRRDDLQRIESRRER